MVASHYETIIRLESILRELECEFLYLIGDMQAETPAAALQLQDLPVERLELARCCLAAAARALSWGENAERV